MKRVGTDCWETRCIVFLFIGGIPIAGCHGEATLRHENVGNSAVERRELAEKVESQAGEQNEAYSIRIGQLEFGVLFENHKISKELKDLIVREIELIYSQLENIYTSELRAGARK